MSEFDIDIDIDGLGSLKDQLRERADDLDQRVDYVVGTAIEYAVYVEFGTRYMDPRPYLRPAVREAQADLEGFISSNTNTTLQQIDDADRLVQTVALALERRIKEIITRKGIIDTGALRASITAVPAGGSLPGLADVAARAEVDLDPETVNA